MTRGEVSKNGNAINPTLIKSQTTIEVVKIKNQKTIELVIVDKTKVILIDTKLHKRPIHVESNFEFSE